MEKRSVIIFMNRICRIGGAETWLYNLTNVLSKYFDVMVLYDNADQGQVSRLKVPAKKREGVYEYRCDILLNMFEGRPINVKARHIVQTVHSNYSEMPWYKYNDWDRTDSYIFASEASKNAFPIPLRKPYKVIQNPIYIPDMPPKGARTSDILHIMSATRLAEEKGGFRMILFCKMLESAGIKFDYKVYTSWSEDRIREKFGEVPKQMIIMPPKLDLTQEMYESDYVAQFSDCEAFCYTIHESLAVHTPVLVTNWKGVDRSVRNGLNGYIFNMDMTGVNLKQLLTRPNIFGVMNSSNRDWIRHLKEIPLGEIKDGRHAFNLFLDK